MDPNKIMEKAIVEAAKDRSEDIYNDGLKPATVESGEALQTIVGWFNNVVLHPVKKANLTYRYKLEQFEEELKENIKKIPDENIIEPPLLIAGPVLEGLKYTFDTKEIREMYIKLLTSAMNKETVECVHPSYVEIIKSMSPLDAIIMKKLGEKTQCPFAKIKFMVSSDWYLGFAMPDVFVPDLVGILAEKDPYLIASGVINLSRLGLIRIVRENYLEGYDYDELMNHPYVKKRYDIYKQENKSENLSIKIDKGYTLITGFGKDFFNTCISYK